MGYLGDGDKRRCQIVCLVRHVPCLRRLPNAAINTTASIWCYVHVHLADAHVASALPEINADAIAVQKESAERPRVRFGSVASGSPVDATRKTRRMHCLPVITDTIDRRMVVLSLAARANCARQQVHRSICSANPLRNGAKCSDSRDHVLLVDGGRTRDESLRDEQANYLTCLFVIGAVAVPAAGQFCRCN
jgi:hypothetical protein